MLWLITHKTGVLWDCLVAHLKSLKWLSLLARGHLLAHTSQYDVSMSTMKQAFGIFCLRETWRSLVGIKIKIFSEVATSALAGFHAGPLVFGDVEFCLWREENWRTHREKHLEHGDNQQKTHCTGIETQSHYLVGGERSHLCVIPAPQDVPQYNKFWIPRSPNASSLEGLSDGHRIHLYSLLFSESSTASGSRRVLGLLT